MLNEPVNSEVSNSKLADRLPLTEQSAFAQDPALSVSDQPTLTEQKWQRSNRYGFTLCGFNFLAQQGHYCELLVDRKPAPLPNSPEHFRGIVNVRGNLVPLYQLEPLLEMPIQRSRYALVLGELAHGAALLIDAKPLTIPESSLSPAEYEDKLPPILSRALVATSKVDDQIWYTINHRQLFTEMAHYFG